MTTGPTSPNERAFASAAPWLLRLDGITKRLGVLTANDGIWLDLRVHRLARGVSRMRRNAMALVLSLHGIGAHALGIDVPYTAFATPDAVTSVQICGTWGAKREGEFRVIHAERHAQSFVYVQWLHRDTDGNRQATQTLAVDELDNDHADISLTDLTCRSTPRGIVLTAKADSGHDPRIRRVTIEIGPTPGRYTFRAQRMR